MLIKIINRRLAYCLFFTVFLLASCSWLEPHRIDIPQGNIITQQQVDKLRLGMNSEQIYYILGSPSLKDPKNPQIWLYVYHLDVQHEDLIHKKLELTVVADSLRNVYSKHFDTSKITAAAALLPTQQQDTTPAPANLDINPQLKSNSQNQN